MATKTIASGRQKAKLAYRQLVQDGANNREIDPDEVESTLMLSGRSYDDLERDTQLLEGCIAEDAAHAAKGYADKISELTALRESTWPIRKQLEADQKLLAERWAECRAMEERANHVHSLQSAQQSDQSQMMAKRRKLLGTNDLEAFPVVG